jgi:hypothetical protein
MGRWETHALFGSGYAGLGKAKIFDFQKTRIGRHYRQKRVEVIYTMEGETSVTVTLYVFFGEWGQHNADSL